jgi:hypothetical protein
LIQKRSDRNFTLFNGINAGNESSRNGRARVEEREAGVRVQSFLDGGRVGMILFDFWASRGVGRALSVVWRMKKSK